MCRRIINLNIISKTSLTFENTRYIILAKNAIQKPARSPENKKTKKDAENKKIKPELRMGNPLGGRVRKTILFYNDFQKYSEIFLNFRNKFQQFLKISRNLLLKTTFSNPAFWFIIWAKQEPDKNWKSGIKNGKICVKNFFSEVLEVF